MRRSACTQVGQRKIFLNGHVGGCAFEGILEQVADDLAALVLRLKGDVRPPSTMLPSSAMNPPVMALKG